jgi:endonuclease YncB( thermonuclease family)
MVMILIEGTFSILNAAPDGDSVRFIPNNPALWKKLETKVHPNKSGGVQLRLDSIDALETHYRPNVGAIGTQHQPKKFADAAATRLLDILGFDSSTVERGKEERVKQAVPDRVPGYIMTRFADVYGRAVAFACKGKSDKPDGEPIFVDKSLIRQTVNYQLLAEGLAYPTFYSKLYVDLRRELTAAVTKARSKKLGIWTEDATNTGFNLKSLKTITDEVEILPKLFRRLLSYLAINNDDGVELDGFAEFLEANNDRILILSEGRMTGFDNVVEIDGQTIKLTEKPENLVFFEK